MNHAIVIDFTYTYLEGILPDSVCSLFAKGRLKYFGYSCGQELPPCAVDYCNKGDITCVGGGGLSDSSVFFQSSRRKKQSCLYYSGAQPIELNANRTLTSTVHITSGITAAVQGNGHALMGPPIDEPLNQLIRVGPHAVLEIWNTIISNSFKHGIWIENGGKVILRNCTLAFHGASAVVIAGGELGAFYSYFHDNEASVNGGAIAAVDGALYLHRCEFKRNRAGSSGGAIYLGGDGPKAFDARASLFLNNSAHSGNGGAVYVHSTKGMSMDSAEFTSNTAVSGSGGAVYVGTAKKDISAPSAVFTSNTAHTDGGALFVYSAEGMSMDSAEFTSNRASSGGAIYMDSAHKAISMALAIFTRNTAASGGGGAVYVVTAESTISTPSAVFTSNTASESGGAIYAHSVKKFSMDSTTFASNTASTSGGAVYVLSAGKAISMASSIFQQNSAVTGHGGAIYFKSAKKITVEHTAFRSNAASQGGAAAFVDGTYTFSRLKTTQTDFTNNAAGGYGGALYLKNVADIDAKSTLFHANQAGSGAGAVYFTVEDEGTGAAEMKHVFTASDGTIFTNNSAGIQNYPGSATVEHGLGGAIYLKGRQSFNMDDTKDVGDDSNDLKYGPVFVGKRTSFVSNTAFDDGGAVYSRGGTCVIQMGWTQCKRNLPGDSNGRKCELHCRL